MIENPNVICNDCGFDKQNKELKDKCERLEKQLNIAIGVLNQYAEAPTRNLAKCALDRIAEIGGDYSHYWEQQIKELKNDRKSKCNM